jgi:hypothetical protein
VFSLTPSGKLTVLHAFEGGADGELPSASLTNLAGTLYSTTVSNGADCAINVCGTVFSLTPAGTESVVYAFGDVPDGEEPLTDGLTNVGGTLYGTTAGGNSAGICNGGWGTVFSVTP